jgi:pimeloyl-ACP methyl ester carboxylesterase
VNQLADEVVFDEMRSINGQELHVRVDRGGPGRPLLLLNGLTRPLERWDPLVGALGGRPIVRFDPPGIGTSPSPGLPLSIDALSRLAIGVLDSVEAPVADVLGYSHGGAIAQQMSHEQPERVGSLILAATTCGVGSVGGFETFRVMLRPDRAFQGGRAVTNPLAILYRSLALACWSSIPFLGAITAPTLVVRGDRDRLVPSANSRILVERIPGATEVTIAAGHDLQHPRCTSELASELDRFLPQISQAPARVPL